MVLGKRGSSISERITRNAPPSSHSKDVCPCSTAPGRRPCVPVVFQFPINTLKGCSAGLGKDAFWFINSPIRFILLISRINRIGEFMNQKASFPNPALQPFSVLIGNWNTTGTHGLLPGAVLHGHTSFEWLEGGAFLVMRSEIDDPRFPSTIAIFGSDNSEGEYYMLTFDERGVSRKYEMSLHDNIWK